MTSCAELPNMTTIDMSKKDSEKIQMTTEEMKRFQECMKDPKFLDLWQDYAKEISDPKHLKEQEEYLKQIEEEAKEAGDHSFTFIFPKPNFCVKVNCAHRFYINVCDDEKVEEPREETTGDRTASQWQVPVCIGKIRDEEFNEKPCRVVDACYHPKSTFLAKNSEKFMVFLVEIAIENVNHTYAKDLPNKTPLPMEFARVGSVPAVGVPAAQTIRITAVKGKEGELVVMPKNGAPQPPPDPKSSFRDKSFADGLAAGLQKKKASKPAPPPPPPPSPPHTVTEQGEVSYQDCWNAPPDLAAVGSVRKRPKTLKVQFSLGSPPWSVRKASDLDMHVEEKKVCLSSEVHEFNSTVALPYHVDPDRAKAKFDKTKQVLTVLLPVVEGPSPDEVQTQEQLVEHRRAFLDEARRQSAEDERELREERERRLAEERQAKEEEERKKAAMRERLEKLAEEERRRQEEEREKRERELRMREQKLRDEQLAALEASKASLHEQEALLRSQAQKEHAQLMRKIEKQIEAAKLADSMAKVSKQKQEEIPFTNPFVFQLD